MENPFGILVVDDDNDIVEFMVYNLEKEGYNVHSAINGQEALKKVEAFTPHLIILDVMMPEMDGIELCERMRNNPKLDQTVIAFLTARGEDYSQIAGFDAGADDYITKPIKPKLLMSRVKALLKRFSSSNTNISEDGTLVLGNLEIDRSSYLVFLNKQELKLPKKEFEILYMLASTPGKVFSRDQIYMHIWGSDVIVGDRTIDVHIRKLREAIGNEKIQTVKGVGYKYMNE
ncbi:MAG: response regulator transcription factor [Bacteroidales bacterium]|nr:response regulator transcription factor [Bacteroidales bacterium]